MKKPVMQRRDSPVPAAEPGPRIGHNNGPSDNDYDIVADRLDGIKDIATFWFGTNDDLACKRAYRLISMHAIPVGKIGGRIIASRRALRTAYERMTAGPPKAGEIAE